MTRLRTWTKPESPRTACVSIDNKIWGTLPVRVLLPFYGIDVDLEIDEDEAEKLVELLHGYARNLLFDYLARSEHPESACRMYLKRKQYHSGIIDACISEAKEKKFLADDRYAEIYIRSLLEGGKSRRFIITKLKLQKIPPSVYEPLFAELIDPEETIERLTGEVLRYKASHSGLAFPKLKEKVFSTLYRKGWELDLIRRAWERALSGED